MYRAENLENNVSIAQFDADEVTIVRVPTEVEQTIWGVSREDDREVSTTWSFRRWQMNLCKAIPASLIVFSITLMASSRLVIAHANRVEVKENKVQLLSFFNQRWHERSLENADVR